MLDDATPMNPPIQKVFLFLLGLFATVTMLITMGAKPVKLKKIPLTEGIVTYPWAKDSPPPWDARLTVMTYNIGYASGNNNNLGNVLTAQEHQDNLDQIIKTICDSNSDVVALQEVDLFATRSHNINQLETIAKACGFGHAALAVTWNKRYIPWPYWPISKHFGRVVSGQAILSRYPIVSYDTILYDKPKSNHIWYNWFYLDRIAQKIILDIGKREVELWNVHFEAFDRPTRLSQAYELAYFLRQHPHNKRIVMGDFNSVSQTREGATVEDNGEALQIFFENGMTNAESPGEFTFPSWNPERKIDHILYSNGVWLVRSGVVKEDISRSASDRISASGAPGITSAASDHLPVVATFGL